MRIAALALLSLLHSAHGWVIDTPQRGGGPLPLPPASEYDDFYFYNPAGGPFDQKWYNASSYNLDNAVLRWSYPSYSFNGSGLAKGLSWALQENFCDKILRKFPEGDILVRGVFLNCNDLNAAVTSAFATWSMNHNAIHFEDISSLCDAGPCLPEISISAANTDGAGVDLAAFVTADFSELDYTPVTTAGQSLNPGVGKTARTATNMTINNEICWYLDNTFCYSFNRWQQQGSDVLSTTKAVFAGIYIFICFLSIWFLLMAAIRTSHQTGCCSCCPLDPAAASDAGIPTNSMSGAPDLPQEGTCALRREWALRYLDNLEMGALLFCVFWLIFCPVFYTQIFLPCWECYDFKATVAHEAGHILGFHHPDQKSKLNLFTNAAMGESTCSFPLSHVQLQPLAGDADSIMFASTKHRDLLCLTDDDLQGLNFLYPTCSGALTEVKCQESKRQAGWLRLGIIVGVPFIICTFVLSITQWIVRRHLQKRLRHMAHRYEEERTRRKGHERAIENKYIGKWLSRNMSGGTMRVLKGFRSGRNLLGKSARPPPYDPEAITGNEIVPQGMERTSNNI